VRGGGGVVRAVDPRLARLLDEVRLNLERTELEKVPALLRRIRAARGVFLFGMGRSGLMAQAFAQRLMHLGVEVHIVGHVTARSITPADLLLVCSASGSTRTTAQVARSARENGAGVAAITGSAEGPLAEASDLVIVVPRGRHAGEPEASGADTRQPLHTLFEQSLLLFLDAVVLALMDDLGLSEQDLQARHANLE